MLSSLLLQGRTKKWQNVLERTFLRQQMRTCSGLRSTGIKISHLRRGELNKSAVRKGAVLLVANYDLDHQY